MLRKLAELYRYRELLRALVVSELKLRYRRSVLGFLWTMLNPFLMMVVLTVFTCGVALVFSCLNVFFRDFTHMTEVLLSMWFYLSPVFYTIDLVPERYRSLFTWNPLFYLITCFRQPVFEGVLPSGRL